MLNTFLLCTRSRFIPSIRSKSRLPCAPLLSSHQDLQQVVGIYTKNKCRPRSRSISHLLYFDHKKPNSIRSRRNLRPVILNLNLEPSCIHQSVCRPPMMSTKSADLMDANRLVWIDLEMTGLNVEKERIIEIACLVTERDLTIVAKGPNIVIHQSDELLNSMDEWCTLHHGQSGLTEAVRNSTITTEEAEAKVLSFVSQFVPQGKCPLAGNSVGTDKLFIERYMPNLAKHLHYRVVDVSTIKELCRRWYPEDFKNAPAKKLTHRAMDDIIESIEELKYYRGAVFKS